MVGMHHTYKSVGEKPCNLFAFFLICVQIYQRMFLVGCTKQGMAKNKNKNHMDLKAKVNWCREEGWDLLNIRAHWLVYVLVYVPLIVFHFLSPFIRVQRCEQSGLLPTGAEVQVLQSSILQTDVL